VADGFLKKVSWRSMFSVRSITKYFLFNAIYSLLFHVNIFTFQAYLGYEIRRCESISLKSWNFRPDAKTEHGSTEIIWKKRNEIIYQPAPKSLRQEMFMDGSQSKLSEAWLTCGSCNNQVVLQMIVGESVSILWLDVHRGSPNFLKLRDTSCVPINAKEY